MTPKKRRSRIRQTRTEWQKVYDQFPGMVQPFIWSDRLPEFVHVSYALSDSAYEVVRDDFKRICAIVREKDDSTPAFHFNLSHTISLIGRDTSLLDAIRETSFGSAFDQLLQCYQELTGLGIEAKENPKPAKVLRAYDQIRDGRSDVAILCKHIMMQAAFGGGGPDPSGLLDLSTRTEILRPENVSHIMARFPPSLGLHGNLDVDWCQKLWLYNYLRIPPIFPKGMKEVEEERFRTTRVAEHVADLRSLYSEFKQVPLLHFYSRALEELVIGFVARICTLSFETIEFVEVHKGEIAELTFRTTLESFITFSWLMKKKDPELYGRFRDYSTGRERFFGEKMAEQAQDETMKKVADDFVEGAIKEAGTRAINVATERGDIFEVKVDKMADEVWGTENQYYMMYKRSSDVVHGHWRVITKYHLQKSLNPMHNGLYMHKSDSNSYSGVTTAFVALDVASKAMATALDGIDDPVVNDLRERITRLQIATIEDYTKYSAEMFKAE